MTLNSHLAKLLSKRDTEYPAGKDAFFHTPVQLSVNLQIESKHMPLALIINVILIDCMVYLLFQQTDKLKGNAKCFL